MSVPEIDREDFRLWLAAKESDEIVGTPIATASCPLAVYLSDRIGEAWTVWPTGVFRGDWLQGPAGSLDGQILPDWAGKLADAIDRHSEDVTAKDALTILDSIEVAP